MRKTLIYTAQDGDVDAVAATLSGAFLDGDLAPWLISRIADRRRIYPRYFEMIAAHGIDRGHVDVTQDQRGVAVWFVHDGSDHPIRDYDDRLAEITGPYRDHFVELDAAMIRHHPVEPHHYLAFLAVHPDQQGYGYGTQLLEHRHRHLDTIGVGAYLEATGTNNQRLYARHGYQPRRPYTIGPAAPYLYPMWRRPALKAGASP